MAAASLSFRNVREDHLDEVLNDYGGFVLNNQIIRSQYLCDS